MPVYTRRVKKKHRMPTTKRVRSSGEKPYPDNDPEWDDLEQRYSQINGDMRKLAQLLAEQ